jgi:putative ABC transport system permease protein
LALFLVPSLLPDPRLAAFIEPVQPLAMLRAAALGFGIALLFSVPSVVQTLRVPPALVFRRDAEPLPGSRWVLVGGGLAAALGLTGAAALQTGSPDLTWRFSLAVVLTAGVLLGAATLLVGILRRLPRERVTAPAWVRHGFAAGARPGAGTLGSIAALGLGLLVLTSMILLTFNIRRQLDSELPTGAPSVFFLDVQPDQWPTLETLLAAKGALDVTSVPVITARLAAIDGRRVEQLLEGRRRGDRWALRREQRLTTLDQLPADNEILAGRLWSDPDHPEVSIERDFAAELGIGLGSEMTFDIQGVERTFRITSVRSVDWESFGLNFYLVMEPGTLERAPQTRLATARLPSDREQQVQDQVIAVMPNVTMLRLRPLLERLTDILGRVATAVTSLGSLTAIAALLILVGTLLVDGPRRAQEVALLRTLGMSRAGILGAFLVEYTIIGTVASLIGCLGGASASYLIARHALEIDWRTTPGLVAALGAGGVLLAAAGGLLANLRALGQPPIAVLRQDD